MINATMALAELAEPTEKGAEIDVQRQTVQFAAQRVMALETAALCGADYEERARSAHQQPERLPRSALEDSRSPDRAGDPQARADELSRHYRVVQT